MSDASYTQVTGKLINCQDAIEAVCKEIISRFDVGITEGRELVEDVLNGLVSGKPETRLVAEITLSQEQIQDAVDKAIDRMRAELAPCDFCKYKDDCGDMAIYCPAERRTDE